MIKHFPIFSSRVPLTKKGAVALTMSQLELFIAQDCPSCVEAQRVASRAAKRFPALDVVITDVDQPKAVIPESVFAVPTFCLDGRVISLGTPEWRQLRRTIQARLA